MPDERRRGRWSRLPAYVARLSCAAVRRFALGGPVFGGTRGAPLRILVELTAPARVTVTVRRGAKVVERFGARRVVQRYTLRPRGLKRGDDRLTLAAGRVRQTLTSRRL